MRAVQLKRVGELVQAEVPKPNIAAGQALLRVTAAGICQTDVHIRRSTKQMIPDGTVLGHEIAGEIIDIANDVQGVSSAITSWFIRSGPAESVVCVLG
ncbi:alcohol dehydrogenase catalytic domain-containing protein [Terriglobus tenax]|uniref:alcohol dehydrogenase catalytic domain-containing protein n=1 Tax=Terriglobus tenax TaxID=1111115 RepID=UPI0021DFCC74|nr:alcohol dehydrogenase catalytic domain-containing protein [Terriglobus tenax]